MKGSTESPGAAADTLGREPRFRNLRWWNLGVGLVLAAHAVVIGVLQNCSSIPVVATYLGGSPGRPADAHKIGEFQLG